MGLRIFAGVEPDGLNLPEDAGSAAVWLLFVVVLVVLYLTLRRTRRRTEEHYRERQEREARRRGRPWDGENG